MESKLSKLLKEFMYMSNELTRQWNEYIKQESLAEWEHDFLMRYEEKAMKVIHPAMINLLRKVRHYGLKIEAGPQRLNGILKLYYAFATRDDEYAIQMFIEPAESEQKVRIDFDCFPFEQYDDCKSLLYDLNEMDEELMNALFIKKLRQYIAWMYDDKIPNIENIWS